MARHLNRVTVFRCKGARNVAHLIEGARAWCGIKYDPNRTVATDRNTRLCMRCARFKDIHDIRGDE